MLTRPPNPRFGRFDPTNAQSALTIALIRAAQINGCDAIGARLIANPNCTTAIAVRVREIPRNRVLRSPPRPSPAGYGPVADSLPLWHSAHDRLDVSGASPRLCRPSRAKT